MSDQPGWAAPGQGPAQQPAPWGGWAPPPPPPPRPGVVPLRPLGFGEVLDGAIGYVRRYPRPTLGLASLVALFMLAVQAVSFVLVVPLSFEETLTEAGGTDTGAGSDVAINALQILQTLLQQTVVLVATGLLTFVMGQAVLGRAVTLKQAWTRVRPRLLSLIGLGIVSLLLIVVALVLPLLPFLLFLLAGQDLLAGLFLLAGLAGAVALGAYVYVNLVLAPSALVLEGIGVRAALRRGRELLAGGFWRTLGICVVGSLISSVVGIVFGMFFAVVGGIGGGVLWGADAAFVGIAGGLTLGTIMASVVTVPFDAGVRALLYLDRRMRREGLDLALARAAGGPTAPAPPGPAVPPPPGPGAQQW